MSHQTPIRRALAATLSSLAILAGTSFAVAQSGTVAGQSKAAQLAVPLLSAEQMTPADRTTAQSWQPAIATSAQFYGYTVDSSFAYREIACPLAQHHLLLAYESTSPNGTVSRFTAVVRRGAGEETASSHAVAEVIPILHFGLVPFIPAIANPHSIEVFNAAISPAPRAIEILSANRTGNQPLLVRALCYLAMVGEEPAALTPPPSSQATILAPVPTEVFQNRGKVRQLISIRSSQNTYQVWTLTFQSGGRLLTATRQEHPVDRTPLMLNAATSGSAPVSAGATSISAGAAQISTPSPPETPLAPAPAVAVTVPLVSPEPTAPGISPTSPAPVTATAISTPPVLPANPPPVEKPASVAPLAAVTPPNTTSVESVPPAIAAPPPTAALAAPPVPEAVPALSSMPQPTNTAAAAPEAPAISAPPPPAAAWIAEPPVVKPSPPLPPGRLIQNPPQPPSRFIPDSALKTPPHLPQ